MKILVLLLFAIAVFFGACKKVNPYVKPGLSNEHQSQIALNYANILEAGYLDSYNAALMMQTKINGFIAKPYSQWFGRCKKLMAGSPRTLYPN